MASVIEQQDNKSRPRLAAAFVLAALLALAACGNDAPGASQPSGSSSPPATVTLPSPPTTPNPSGDNRGQTVVLDQYRSFFHALPEASRLDKEPQITWLRRYLTKPALSQVAGTLAAQRAYGKVLYGEAVLRPDAVAVHGSTATIRDCQDTSASGVQDVKTGRQETKGLPRTLVVTTLKAIDGTWKISSIDYRGPKC